MHNRLSHCLSRSLLLRRSIAYVSLKKVDALSLNSKSACMKQHTGEHMCSFSRAWALPAVSWCSLQRTSCLISCSPSVKWRCNCCSGAWAWYWNQLSVFLSVFPYPYLPLFNLKVLACVRWPSTGWANNIDFSIRPNRYARFYILSGFHCCHLELLRNLRASRGCRAPCTRSSRAHLVCHFDCSHTEAV